MASRLRVGIDLGGTKIAAVALDREDRVQAELRRPSPQGDYAETIGAIAGLIAELERQAGAGGSVGIGMPGSISPSSGLVQNANSTWLNGRPLKGDLEARLGHPVRLANDANCFALSEATDGAAAGAATAFGIIVGTGCGGGLVVGGRLIDGPRGIGGEWGHNPLPWAEAGEWPGQRCWCGRLGCLETWISGPAMAADHHRVTGVLATAEAIAADAQAGNKEAEDTLARYASRLARGIAHIVNIFDPEIVVLGGGLSQIGWLYEAVPELAAPYIFADSRSLDIRPPRYGDASGVRGAARLWPAE